MFRALWERECKYYQVGEGVGQVRAHLCPIWGLKDKAFVGVGGGAVGSSSGYACRLVVLIDR